MDIVLLSVHNVVNSLTTNIPPDYKPYNLPIDLMDLGSCFNNHIGKVETLRSLVYDAILELRIAENDWNLFCNWIDYLRRNNASNPEDEDIDSDSKSYSYLYEEWFTNPTPALSAISIPSELLEPIYDDLKELANKLTHHNPDGDADEDIAHPVHDFIESVDLTSFTDFRISSPEHFRAVMDKLRMVVYTLQHIITLTQYDKGSTVVIGTEELLIA